MENKFIYLNSTKKSTSKINWWWLNFFKPNIFISHFSQLPIHILKKKQIKVFICDLDNTLLPYYTSIPSRESLDFVKSIKDSKIKFVIISNNKSERVSALAKKYNADYYVGFAKKPSIKAIKKVCKEFNVGKDEILVMGDQLLTDILMANRFGCESILVSSLTNEDYELNTVFKWIGAKIYKKLSKDNIIRNFENFDENPSNNSSNELFYKII